MRLRNKRSRVAAALGSAILLLAACGGAPSGDESSPPTSSDPASGDDGVLAPLPDGFPEGAITLIVVDDAGSDDGIYARQLQSVLADVSPVRINVSDRPDFGSTYGTFEALQQSKELAGGDEGYVVVIADLGGTLLDLLQTNVGEELDVGISDANWVLGQEVAPLVIVSRTGAPWEESFEEMISYCQANPGEIVYVSRGPGSLVDTAFKQYMEFADCEVTTVVGGSAQEIAIALGGGEGDVAISVIGVTQPVAESGRIHTLACTGNVNPCPGDWDTEIPTVGSVIGIDDDPWGITRVLAVLGEVPDEHRNWLYELFRLAADDEGFRTDRAQQVPGLEIVDWDHDELTDRGRNVLEYAYPVLEELGLVDPSVTWPLDE